MKLKPLHKKLLLLIPIIAVGCFSIARYFPKSPISSDFKEAATLNFDLARPIILSPDKKGKKKTPDERAMFHWARVMHEYYRQVNPLTGTVSKADKFAAIRASKLAPVKVAGAKSADVSLDNFAPRGPGNLGGRTRAVVFDLSDATGNTVLAGAVSGGVFRTTNGGASWTRVSPMDEIHNVTTIAQDPRPGFQNIWYYGTGESLGNSASINGAAFMGRGVWRSTDNGITWVQVTGTNSVQETFDNRFDFIHRIAVHPTTGQVFAGIAGRLVRFDGTTWNTELNDPTASTTDLVDVVITPSGRVYAAFAGRTDATVRGVWTSATGTGGWTRIATNGTPTGWSMSTTSGRVVLGLSASNQNIVYALYLKTGATGSPGDCDLWRWNQATTTWTNFSTKIPDEAGGSAGNDPFNSQGAYDLVVSVKPDNENFVVIGGTNVYKVTNINTANFVRIGGYDGPSTYALWNNGGGAQHHPDVHALTFNPFNANSLVSGTDGGIHRTIDLNAATVGWVNLNNNYQTYQYYHVSIDPQSGSDGVLGGAQDNGTTVGGVSLGLPNSTTMGTAFSGDGCACAISRADACTPFFMTSQSGNLFRDCPTAATITPAGSSSDFVTYFWLDPDNNSNIYYAGQNRLYKSNNSSNVTTAVGTGGTQWQDLGVLPGTEWINTMTTTRGTYTTTHDLFIGGDEGGIYRLTNPANATGLGGMVNITPAGATIGFPSYVTGLSVHPTNSDILLAGYSNYGTASLFLTSNANAATPTWVNVERNIAALSIRSVAVVEASGVTLYVAGTERGLFTSPDPTTTDWTRVAPTAIGFAVVSSLQYRPADNKLLIGTHGNGLFIADVLPPTLPIELTRFEGRLANKEIQLTWTTASEENNEGFEIQRAFDAVNFEVIGFVNGKGTSTELQNYSFPDPQLKEPIQYYRLRQIDFDGSESFSEVVAVSTGLAPNQGVYSFHTYPNPVQDELNIELSRTPKTGVDVELYSVKGERVYFAQLNRQSRILKLSFVNEDIAQGIYVLRIIEDGKLLGTQKIYKMM